jgi:hypothetical protein
MAGFMVVSEVPTTRTSKGSRHVLPLGGAIPYSQNEVKTMLISLKNHVVHSGEIPSRTDAKDW